MRVLFLTHRLPYAPTAETPGSLRPEIRIETAVWPLRRPSIDLPLISFVAEAHKRQPEVALTPSPLAGEGSGVCEAESAGEGSDVSLPGPFEL